MCWNRTHAQIEGGDFAFWGGENRWVVVRFPKQYCPNLTLRKFNNRVPTEILRN